MQTSIIKDLPQNALHEVLGVLHKYSGLMNPLGSSSLLLSDTKTPGKGICSSELDRMDAEALKLESLAAILHKSMLHHIAAIRRRRNLLVPIYRLPSEVLALIFIGVQGYERDYGKAYQTIKQLAEVSSRWFSTVLTTPGLWTQVEDSFHPEFLKSVIRQSACAPLHVRLVVKSSKSTQFDLLLSHADRWVTLECLSIRAIEGLNQKMKFKTLSKLQSFTARDIAFYRSVQVPEVIRSQALGLRELSITPLSFPLEASFFSSLRMLEFNPEHDGVALSSAQWHSLLTASSQLEHIRAVSMTGRQPQEPFPIFYAYLPSLRTIELSHLYISVSGALMASVCPRFNTYPRIIMCPSSPGNAIGALFPSSPWAHSLLQMVRSMQWISIQGEWGSHGAIRIKAGRHPSEEFLDISLNLSISEWNALTETLVTLADAQILDSLFLSNPSLFQGSEVAMRALSDFPGLKKLTLVHPNWPIGDTTYNDNLAKICNRLSSPLIGDDGVERGWLLPCLTHLVIAGNVKFDAVLPLVKERFSSHPSNAPEKLEILQLTSLTLNGRDAPTIDSALVGHLHELLSGQGTELRINWRVGDD